MWLYLIVSIKNIPFIWICNKNNKIIYLLNDLDKDIAIYNTSILKYLLCRGYYSKLKIEWIYFA